VHDSFWSVFNRFRICHYEYGHYLCLAYLGNAVIGKRIRRENIRILQTWITEHADYPYPTSEDVKKLSKHTGLKGKQIRVWFTNFRYASELNLFIAE
jgi:hypothetical protein